MSANDTTVLVDNGNPPITPRTQYSLSKREIVHGIANRIIYSRFYTWLYLGMALLCVVSIALSFTEDCQSTGFLTLDVIINIVMIAEVITRFLALGKLFWKSIFNTIDLILVVLCVITLSYILGGGCSHKGEEIFDLILLIARNLIQLVRVCVIVKKNKKNIKTRNATVDFARVRDPSVSMDNDSISHGAILTDDDEEDDIF